MNRRNFLKWIGVTTAVAASPKAEAVAKEVEKVGPVNPEKLHLPMTPGSTNYLSCPPYCCFSGPLPMTGPFAPVYDKAGNFIGWGSSGE